MANYRQTKIIVVFLAALLLGFLVCPDSALAKNDVVEGEYIIKYKDSVDAQTKSKVLKKHALENRKNFKIINAQLVKLPAAQMQPLSESSLLEELAADPAIEYIEPNYRLYPLTTSISTEADAALLWGLKNFGQQIPPSTGSYGEPGVDINLETAWLITQGNPNVLVAVIDTGVDISHPDLVDAIWTNQAELYGLAGEDDDGNGFIDDIHGWDFCHDDSSLFDRSDLDAYQKYVDNHGTHCAGIIAAAQNNTGVVGVAPGVKILPLKFIGAGGGYTSDAIDAIQYAQAAGAKLVNCSWGSSNNDPLILSLQDAIANSGMLFVAAAGNSAKNIDSTPLYPASFDLDNIITVAAIDNQGSLASFSNYGPLSVDVAAPGKYIYSTLPEGAYGYLDGTSMATAYVSGIAALVVSAGYTDNTTIKQRILDSASQHPLERLQGIIHYGGLVDAAAAAQIEMAPLATAYLTSLQILNGTENLLTGFSNEQTSYTLTVDATTVPTLQILYTGAVGCTVTVSYNGALLTGDQISLNGQSGTLTVLVRASDESARTYTITINQTDNCFIATAAFGSKFAPAVKMLRSFRDEYLLTNEPGRTFVAFYYRHSPPLANYIADREGLRMLARILLTPFIAGVYLLYNKWLLAAVLILAAVIFLLLKTNRRQNLSANCDN